MKKILLALLIGSVTFTGYAAQGGFVDNSQKTSEVKGGFLGPKPQVTTVDKARQMSDDAWVVLQGHIERELGHERYEFRDATGTITVEIDDKRWQGQQVTPKDEVRIEGEVDKERHGTVTEIDVKKVILIQK